MSDIGHNSGDTSAEQLRLFIERIERINEEIEDRQGDRKDIYAEVKATGFDTKTVRFVVAQRKMEKEKRDEQRALQETYLNALGLL